MKKVKEKYKFTISKNVVSEAESPLAAREEIKELYPDFMVSDDCYVGDLPIHSLGHCGKCWKLIYEGEPHISYYESIEHLECEPRKWPW